VSSGPDTSTTSSTAARARQGGFAALRDRFFANYIAAYALSMTGMMVRVTAMGYLVYDLTGDPFLLGVMSFAQVAPEIIFGPVAAAVLDRLDRRRLLIVIQVVYIVTLLALMGLLALDVVEFWHLVVIGAVLGTGASFDWPARMALVPTLVERPLLSSAVAINAATFNGARVIGPSLGGWLIGLVGVMWCFGVYALALLPFIAMLVVMPHDRRPVARRSGGSPWSELREGYRYIWEHKPIRAMLTVDIVPIMLGMSYLTMAPAFARDVLHMGSEGLGYLLSGSGFGSLLGTLLVARMSGMRGRGLVVTIGVGLFGVALIAFGLSSTLVAAMGMIIVVGLIYGIYSTMNDTLIQSTVDDDYRGRVSATYSMIWGLSPVGGLIAGTLANFVGVQWAIAICGMLVILYLPYLWFFTPLRTVD
jgi:MFS family permease